MLPSPSLGKPTKKRPKRSVVAVAADGRREFAISLEAFDSFEIIFGDSRED